MKLKVLTLYNELQNLQFYLEEWIGILRVAHQEVCSPDDAITENILL